MSTIQNTVSARMKALRTNRKMTQWDLAKATGLSQSSITAYERGTRKPDLDALYSIAKGLYAPLSALFEDYSVTYFDQVDMDRLKAFHQDQRLTILFDRIRHLSESDFTLVSQIINRMQH